MQIFEKVNMGSKLWFIPAGILALVMVSILSYYVGQFIGNSIQNRERLKVATEKENQEVLSEMDFSEPTPNPLPTNAEIQGSSQQHNYGSAPTIECTDRDGTVFRTTKQACDGYHEGWRDNTKVQPTQEQVPFQTSPGSSNGTTSNRIDCIVEGKSYRLTPSECSYWRSYMASIKSISSDYKAENDRIMQEYQRKATDLQNREYQSELTTPQVVVPTATQIKDSPRPTCTPIGHSQYELCGQ